MDKLQRDVLLAALDWHEDEADVRLIHNLRAAIGKMLFKTPAYITMEQYREAVKAYRAKLTESENGQ